jgi:hypothetical protein
MRIDILVEIETPGMISPLNLLATRKEEVDTLVVCMLIVGFHSKERPSTKKEERNRLTVDT